ncbi:MAG TPA: ATP-binding protein [Vicinamibacterales bacterium]|jgi:signal transduction histidine kinase|nr:ATP-binding protein [Vicinamibacterales bacterium]
MRLTFRTKLMTIVGITAFAFLLLIATGAVLAKRVALQLATIQTRYVPKVELEPQLDAQFDRIRRGFQDAVAIRDADGLAATGELKRRFLSQLDAAGPAVDAADAQALRVAIEDYQATAADVSRRLIAGETGEALVDAVRQMQVKQVRVQGCINKAAALDRRELTQAFAAAAQAQRTARMVQGWISVSCLAAVLAVSLLLSRGVLGAVVELIRGLERFGSADFRQPIRVETRDELGDVAAYANAMAANLERSDRERERAEAALRLSNRELEAFSYSVAHDLRAPLRGINGLSKVLLEDLGDRLDDEAKDHLARIAAAAQRMGTLIDALLALSRVTRTELHRESVDLSRLAEAVVHQLRLNEPVRAVDFVNEPGVMADADPPLLRAVLENLLGNAWKFTAKRDRAQIAFGSELMGGSRVYYVRDNGAGFDMAYADKLFAPFQRLHTTAEFVGTGVGLATVQRIVDRHGGRIWADGVVGEGATFRFTLPSSAEGPIP